MISKSDREAIINQFKIAPAKINPRNLRNLRQKSIARDRNTGCEYWI